MATVTLADERIHSVLSLATSPTPTGGVILMIAMSHHIVYSLKHQSNAGIKTQDVLIETKQNIKHSFFSLDSISATLLCDKCHFWCFPSIAFWKGSETQRARRRAAGSTSHLAGQTRGPLSSAAGSRPAPPLSPVLSGIAIQLLSRSQQTTNPSLPWTRTGSIRRDLQITGTKSELSVRKAVVVLSLDRAGTTRTAGSVCSPSRPPFSLLNTLYYSLHPFVGTTL